MSLPVVPDHPVGWSVRHALALLLAAQVAQVFWYVAVAGLLGLESGATISLPTLVVLQLALVATYLGGTVALTRRLGRGPVADLNAAGGRVLTGRDVAVGIAVGIAAQLVAINGLYFVIGQFVEVDAGEAARQLADRAADPLATVALVWMTIVVAPLIEEVFFRGLLLRALGRSLPDGLALVISAALFALVHFQPIQAAGLFVIGVVAGAAALRTGRLGAAWAVHVGFNLTAVVQLLVFS